MRTPPNPPAAERARKQLAEQVEINQEHTEYEALIDAEVEAAPPLRPEQIALLSALFDCPDTNSGAA